MCTCPSLYSSEQRVRHAGVRARQEKVTFATCEDEGTLEADVKPLVGQPSPHCHISCSPPCMHLSEPSCLL